MDDSRASHLVRNNTKEATSGKKLLHNLQLITSKARGRFHLNDFNMSKGDGIMSLERIWLVTTPRTASNLFVRILDADNQPNTVQKEYTFHPAFDALEGSGCLEKPREEWTDQEIIDLKKVYQERFENLQSFTISHEDKRVVLKEHLLFVVDPTARIHSAGPSIEPELLFKTTSTEPSSTHLENFSLPLNVTVLPNEFLASWFPVFLIRHPAIIFPSYYRTYVTHWAKTQSEREAMKGEIQSAMSLRWVRSLYNWYTALWEQTGKETPQPIILDAEDFMADPEIIARFCDVVGLDRSKLQLSWEPASKEALENTNPGDRRMKDTLLASTGIDPGKIKREVSLEEEMKKWTVEFGEAGALELADWVNSALPDYEFLRGRKFS